jgi:hypothetical protein
MTEGKDAPPSDLIVPCYLAGAQHTLRALSASAGAANWTR